MYKSHNIYDKNFKNLHKTNYLVLHFTYISTRLNLIVVQRLQTYSRKIFSIFCTQLT